MIITIDGKLHHLKELDFIERQLSGLFSTKDFYENLIKYIKASPNINIYKDFFTKEETKAVDTFIKNYFSTMVDDARISFLRAYVVGKLLADTDLTGTAFQSSIEKLAQMPTTVQNAVKQYNLSIEEAGALKASIEQGASLLTNTINNTQIQVKNALLETIQHGEGLTGLEKRLKELLIDESGELNRDWHRVAITETNSAFANGYLSVMNDREFVIGFAMADACKHCIELLHLKVYQVLKEPPPDYSNAIGDEYNRLANIWENYVWEGKNNYGRSASPTKRIDKHKGNKKDNLMYREHHELIMPVIPLHPNCRCRWVSFDPEYQFVDEDEKEIKLKVENPTKHKNWYEANIKGYGEPNAKK